MNPNDPRVLRTRAMLRDALISLTVERGYNSLTIQDITERAGLRRATFYLHYRDREELLMALMREVVDALVIKMEAIPYDILTPDAEYHMHLITFEHVAANADLYRAIMHGQSARILTAFVREYVADKVREKCAASLPDVQPAVPIEILANYIAVLKINMALWWVEKGMPYTPHEMATLCGRLSLYGSLSAFPDATTPDLDPLLPLPSAST